MLVTDDPNGECVFSVVGRHRDDPGRLLLCGDDGRYYQLDPIDCAPEPIESIDDWIVEFRLAS